MSESISDKESYKEAYKDTCFEIRHRWAYLQMLLSMDVLPAFDSVNYL